MSLKHPIIWLRGRRATGSRKVPMQVPFRNLKYLFLQQKQKDQIFNTKIISKLQFYY